MRNTFSTAAKNACISISRAMAVNHLKFVRVLRVVVPDASGESSGLPYFWGRAETVGGIEKNPQIIWFNQNGRRTSPLFLGPVTFYPSATLRVRRNDILLGRVVAAEKGAKFQWWIAAHMRAFKFFVQALPYHTRCGRQSRFLYNSLKLGPQSADADALYVLFRLVKHGDVGVVFNEMLSRDKRERHVGREKEQGGGSGDKAYRVRRGYRIGVHALKYLALACMLCNDASYFRHVVPRMRKLGLLNGAPANTHYVRYRALLDDAFSFHA